jgi:hypothetical protein
LTGELQETKNFLQSEADRIERETARYMNLTQMASASVKIIFDTARQAGHPMREFEIMRSPAKGTLFRDDEMIALVRACGNAAKIGSNPRQAADRLSEDGQARDHLRHRDHRAGRPHATA